MIREELIGRSPFRILEKSIRGGVGKGNIGIIAARKGVGKTACLVHLATDQLFQMKHVIHVSFSPDTSHIVAWYEDIFEEIAERYKLEGAMELHDELVRHRIILNFRQDGVSAEQVQHSLLSIIDNAKFGADVIVVDGYDFTKTDSKEFGLFKKLAEDLNIELWFSATLHRDDPSVDNQGIPALLSHIIDKVGILVMLDPQEDYIHLTLTKDHEVTPHKDLHLKLDPQILLIADGV
jgi:KaiC/GvpD/RAD55 family RecA-like ATPase